MSSRTVSRLLSRLAILLSLLFIIAFAMGCVVQQPAAPAEAPQAEEPAEAPQAEEPAEAAEEAPQAEEPAEAAAPATLRIMHWTPAMIEQTPWWKEILDGFAATHPNVTIENNFVALPQYLPSLEAMAAGDELPDVFFAHVKAAELGRAGRTVNYKDNFDDAFFEQFYAGPLRQFTFDGDKVYAVPWTAQMFGIFVNDTIMKELGLEAPETWDQLLEMTPKIKEAGLIPLVWGNQARNVCPDFVLPLITQYGGDVYALDDLTDPNVSWNSEPVINAFALLKRLADSGVFVDGINGVTEEQGWQLAFQGRAAMLYTGSWVHATVEEQAPEEYASTYYVAKNPALASGDVHWSGNGSGEGWAINATSPNKDLAIEFVTYLLSPEVYRKFIEGSQNMPSMPSALEMVENEKVREMTTWIGDEGSDHILFGQGSWDAISNVCQGLLDGSMEPEAAAAQVQADVEASRAR